MQSCCWGPCSLSSCLPDPEPFPQKPPVGRVASPSRDIHSCVSFPSLKTGIIACCKQCFWSLFYLVNLGNYPSVSVNVPVPGSWRWPHSLPSLGVQVAFNMCNVQRSRSRLQISAHHGTRAAAVHLERALVCPARSSAHRPGPPTSASLHLMSDFGLKWEATTGHRSILNLREMKIAKIYLGSPHAEM